MTKYCIDTSVWIAYFRGEIVARAIIEEQTLVTSALALVEVADKYETAARNSEIPALLKFITANAEIIPVTIEISLAAAVIKKRERKLKPKFGIIDAVHIATAGQEEAVFVTRDNDFRAMSHCKII